MQRLHVTLTLSQVLDFSNLVSGVQIGIWIGPYLIRLSWGLGKIMQRSKTQIETTVRYHFIPARLATVRKNRQVLAGMGRNWNPHITWLVGMLVGAAAL